MKLTADNQLSPVAGMDPFLQKLSSTPQLERGKCSKVTSKVKRGCSNLKTLFKQVMTLSVFHVLNTFVAVGGVFFVVLMLASMALMPLWLMTVGVGALLMLMLHCVMSMQHVFFNCLGCFVVLALTSLMLVKMNFYIIAVFTAGGIGVGLFYLSIATMKALVRADISLANFISPTVLATTDLQDPERCVYKLEFSEVDKTGVVLPHLRMTRRTWTATLYFSVVKIVIGVLSAAVVFAVILPFIVLFSGDNGFLVGRWITFQENPYAYVVVIALLWVVGAIGLYIVAALSVRLIFCVCGVWESKQQTTDQHSDEVEPTVLLTPVPDSSATSYQEVEALTPST